MLVCIALLLHSYIYHQTLLETFWNLTLLKQPPCDTVVTLVTWHSIQCRNAHSDSDTTLAISCAIAVLCRRQVQKSSSCRGGAKSEFRQNTTRGESFRIIDEFVLPPKHPKSTGKCLQLVQRCFFTHNSVTGGALSSFWAFLWGRDSSGLIASCFFFLKWLSFPWNFQHRLADGLRVPSMLNQCVV